MAALGVVQRKIQELRQVTVPPPPDRNPSAIATAGVAPVGYHQALENMVKDATVLENKVCTAVSMYLLHSTLT